MKGSKFGIAALLLVALFAGPAAMAADGDSSAGGEAASWRHTKMTFNYFGFTAHYTCNGIEEKTRRILLLFGARKDAKVRATGCGGIGGVDRPGRSAWVTVEFDAPAPGAPAAGGEAVNAVWTPLDIAANRPFDMGAGDCELVEQMRDVLTKGFALKDLEYRTNCVPHQMTLDPYHIKGKVLRAQEPATH